MSDNTYEVVFTNSGNTTFDNLYDLAEKSIASGAMGRAMECCEKIHEKDAKNFKAWCLKSRIVGTLYLGEYRDTSVVFSDDYSSRAIEVRYANEVAVRNKKQKLSEYNNKTFRYADIAYSCANTSQKIDLLNMLTSIVISHIPLLFFASKELRYRRPLLLSQQHDGYFSFVKNHYDERITAVYIDKYVDIVLSNVEKIKEQKYLIDSGRVLKRLQRNIDNNSFWITKEKLASQISAIDKIVNTNRIIKELEKHVANAKDSMEWIKDGQPVFINSLNIFRQKLSSKYNPDMELPAELKKEIEEVLNFDESKYVKKGCYVATCVYGSYDCSEVWVLRRFRDYTLDKTWYGRAFIKIYYSISPKFVKLFGNTKWFKKCWKCVLDNMVRRLKNRGYKDTKYTDKYW